MVSAPLAVSASTGPLPRLSDGSKTSTIYSLLRDQQYSTAVQLLSAQLTAQPMSRPALSLLSFAYYHSGDFQSAAQSYAQLCELCPDVADYRFNWAQALYKAGLYADALSVVATLAASADWQQRVQALTAAIHFEQDNTAEAYAALARCDADDSTMFARACLLYKDGQHQQAAELFQLVHANSGPAPDLTYAQAACHYRLQQLPAALKLLTEHIEQQVKLHPQLSVGARLDAASSSSPAPAVLSVGNSAALRDSFLVEAFNLKAAIEYGMGSPQHASESLLDMPPRDEHELDVVTLHNTALLGMDANPADNLSKLAYVLTAPNQRFPREAFHNLLLVYCRLGYLDLCADILADNAHLIPTLRPDVHAYLDCFVLLQSSAAEAYRKLEHLAGQYIERLRKCTKNIQDLRLASSGSSTSAELADKIKAELKQYDSVIEMFLPVLMTQCKIYWERGNFEQCEKILKLNAEFCSESDVFKLNVAHVFFMQEVKYREAIKYYEYICKKAYGNILTVQPSILANLCVSYIMCSENEEAEELMRLIEKEEEKSQKSLTGLNNSTATPYHLCIVNLVIGTLYCSKGNFEFGISRIIKSFEPMVEKLNVDTWFYAKRNVLTVLEYTAKNMFVMKREFFQELDGFLSDCEKHGRAVKVLVPGDMARAAPGEEWKNNVSYEARLLKTLLYKLKD